VVAVIAYLVVQRLRQPRVAPSAAIEPPSPGSA
jgi:hypothetical protein